MTTSPAPQRDAAAPALPRATKQLIDQLDGWTHTVSHARGPATFGGLSEDTDGDGKRHRIEITEDVDSVCLRARHPDDGRAFVAVWWRRPEAKSWRLEDAFRGPVGAELALKKVSATELAAYITQLPLPDPRIAEQLAQRLAAAEAELASLRTAHESVRDAWVPVPMRWRHVQVGSVIVGRDGRLWTVASFTERIMTLDGRTSPTIGVLATCGTEQHGTPYINLDASVQVLVPVPERDALTLSRAVLGSRIMERESA